MDILCNRGKRNTSQRGVDIRARLLQPNNSMSTHLLTSQTRSPDFPCLPFESALANALIPAQFVQYVGQWSSAVRPWGNGYRNRDSLKRIDVVRGNQSLHLGILLDCRVHLSRCLSKYEGARLQHGGQETEALLHLAPMTVYIIPPVSCRLYRHGSRRMVCVLL